MPPLTISPFPNNPHLDLSERAKPWGWNYTIGNRIGKGSFGTVHLVTDTCTGVRFCLKRIDLCGASDKERLRAVEEVRLLRRLAYTGVVNYIDHCDSLDVVCIVMEYCEGGDLAQLIGRRAQSNLPFLLLQLHRSSRLLQLLLLLHWSSRLL